MKILQRTFLGVFAAGIALILANSAKANLVVNGDFESGDFTGWALFGNTGFTGVSGSFGGVSPESGSYQAYFGAVGSAGGIAQTVVTTTPGASYSFDFWLYNFGGTPSSVNVTWGGSTVLSEVNPGSFGYTEYSYTETATSSATSIAFAFQQNPSYFLLDNVSVTPVPEPTTMVAGAMLLLPFGVSAVRMLRKSRVA